MTKSEFLVAKEKMLVALATILPSVASKCVHVRKKHVVIGGKRDMVCRQTFEVWSWRLLWTRFVPGLDSGHWTVDTGLWTLDSGLQIFSQDS